MTLEDVKKKAREMGSNAIMIRHDLNKVYYKKFNDTLLPTDLFVAGDHCDMYIFDTALERVRLNQTFKGCWRTLQGFDVDSSHAEVVQNFKKSGLTIQDLINKADANGWNAIVYRQDKDIAYLKTFDKHLQVKDLKLNGSCDMHFVDPDYKVPEDGWFEYKSFEN